MTLNDAYYEFSILVNKNSERKDINIDKINYAVLYNRESLRYIAEFIERNNSSDNIFTISEFITTSQLFKNSVKKEFVEYDLPEDFFKILPGKSYSEVTGDCGSGIVYNWFKKPAGFNSYLEDDSSTPSFGWEQGLGELEGNKIIIYKTDFEIDKTFISYYKKPVKIDLKDPDFNLELNVSEFVIGQINDRIASEVLREFGSPLYNVAETRKQITI
jgi:hypothetical protein